MRGAHLRISTGLVGTALSATLEANGHGVGRLSRHGARGPDRVAWNPEVGPDPDDLSDWDAIVHLAGKNVAAPWTAANQREIRDSRVVGTGGLAEATARAKPRPRVFVSASAIGYYGDRGDEVLQEDAAPGEGFLADVCRGWEAATDPARSAGVRVVNTRFGLILAKDGGPLAKMLTPFRLGLGGSLGSGQQWMSWVTLEDVVSALVFALETDRLEGAVNVTAPEPVTNSDFTKKLGSVLNRPTWIPVPAFALKLLPGGMGREMFLASQRVVPAALTSHGFRFAHAGLDEALQAIVGRSRDAGAR